MNQEYERIQKLIKAAEDEARKRGAGKYRNGFHIMPPTGWLNDPNGLCQMGDEYHLFFQYSPLDARGGMKAWGHYMTKDFVTLEYMGAPFVPDESFDKNGVYSGSAYIDENGMHIFYTGNVKLPGDYDYVNSGRRADTVLVESRDGKTFGEKRVVIDTDEYPEGYSCHIRDPKVWKENDSYYMVLGARTIDSVGEILIYTSKDMYKWSLYRVISSEEPFGYMWECPDIFHLDGFFAVSFSPQGLDAEEYRYQNTYQSGYVLLKDNPLAKGVENVSLEENVSSDSCNGKEAGEVDVARNAEKFVIDQEEFIEWDMGFDFYAPQTFKDNSGRRILVGWAGMPDPGYENAETETENWQHCFTVPRCLKVREGTDGRRRVFQAPVKELEALRTGKVSSISFDDGNACSDSIDENTVYSTDSECLDILCENISGGFSIGLDASHKGLFFSYDGSVLSLSLSDECGFGRKTRKAKIERVHSLRVLVDTSVAEFYVNDGEMVFTTRYYKKDAGVNMSFDMQNAAVTVYETEKMKVR